MAESSYCSAETVSCRPIKTVVPKSMAATVAINHNVDRTVMANIGGVQLPVFHVKRRFSLSGNRAYDVGNLTAVYGVANAVGENNPEGVVTCGGNSTQWNAGASVDESCEISSCIFHYINMQENVIFFERRTDTLSFGVSSNKIAWFRTRWGSFITHQFFIPKGITASRRKQFVFMKDGVERVLSDLSSTFDVFPETAGAIATGGLGSTDINQAELDAARNTDVSGIALILCVPQPPGESTATILNPEILRMGFYDYTLVGDNLGILDGGKDFFYPEWIRNMTPDPYWASEAYHRWYMVVEHSPAPAVGEVVPELQWELAPQCSYAKHPTEGEMWSWVFTDGNGQGRSFCELNGQPVDPLLAKAVAPHTLAAGTAYTPLSLY